MAERKQLDHEEPVNINVLHIMRIWISSWKIKKEQEGPTSVCMYVGKVVGFQQNIIDKYLALEKRYKNYTEL